TEIDAVIAQRTFQLLGHEQPEAAVAASRVHQRMDTVTERQHAVPSRPWRAARFIEIGGDSGVEIGVDAVEASNGGWIHARNFIGGMGKAERGKKEGED